MARFRTGARLPAALVDKARVLALEDYLREQAEVLAPGEGVAVTLRTRAAETRMGSIAELAGPLLPDDTEDIRIVLGTAVWISLGTGYLSTEITVSLEGERREELASRSVADVRNILRENPSPFGWMHLPVTSLVVFPTALVLSALNLAGFLPRAWSPVAFASSALSVALVAMWKFRPYTVFATYQRAAQKPFVEILHHDYKTAMWLLLLFVLAWLFHR